MRARAGVAQTRKSRRKAGLVRNTLSIGRGDRIRTCDLYVPNVITTAFDAQLRSSDWTQANDSPLLEADREAWATYRAALRVLPQQAGFPDVEWPRAPNLADGTADQPDPSTRTSPTRA
ncbi:phage tail assembly chaperone [Lysobacter antibioticus]|uniref:phage tail assembly chaperone n=1 Tax=Lysobacter antibioticus TaxID=84531 RepID=UPI00126A3034